MSELINNSNCVQIPYSYKDAILKLNALQSALQVKDPITIQQERGAKNVKSLPEMYMYLECIGITNDSLASLNTVHVAGTKGKGSTCAFTESILRHAGLKTGFFSSPHLSVVRERIRIDGIPISKQKFSEYFFQVYSRLISCQEKDPEFTMPPYFRFLTCMAFYTFLQEKVDVAIMEVGIGGRYDSTNIIKNPTVVGITSLGLEHQAILGDTLPEIAAHKAGIMKTNCPAFTVNNHSEIIFKVLQDNAKHVKCTLSVTPDLSELSKPVQLGVDDGCVSKSNASLAVQLASSFLIQRFPEKITDPLSCKQLDPSKINLNLSSYHLEGLRNTKWPGRFQIITRGNVKFFLDGAHTIASLEVSLNWFKKSTVDNSFRILIFNVTGLRNSKLLTPFAEDGIFDIAIFCPVARRNLSIDMDNWSSRSLEDDLLESCKKHCEHWKITNQFSPTLTFDDTDSAIDFIYGLSSSNTRKQYLESFRITYEGFEPKEFSMIEVMITGSLHLVGNILSILDPSLNDENTD